MKIVRTLIYLQTYSHIQEYSFLLCTDTMPGPGHTVAGKTDKVPSLTFYSKNDLEMFKNI